MRATKTILPTTGPELESLNTLKFLTDSILLSYSYTSTLPCYIVSYYMIYGPVEC